MLNMQKTNFRQFENDTGTISLACYILCAIFFLIIGILPLLPGSFTQILRPLFILVSIVFPCHYYHMGRASRMQLFYLLFFGIILISNELTGSAWRAYFSMVLFGLFFVFASQHVWNRREIVLILKSVIIAGAICAVVLLIDNRELLELNNTTDLIFFTSQKNRNAMAYSVAPASVCSAVFFVYGINGRFSIAKRLFYAATFTVCSFVVIATGARSASVAMMVGVFLIGWEWAREGKTAENSLFLKTFVVLISLAILWLLIRFTAGTSSERIFNDLGDVNGREGLWEFAKELIRQKPIFGGGFDYWDNMQGPSLGTHNTYLTIMVISGYTGAFFLTVLLATIVLELLSVRNLIPFAFIIELLLHTYSESSLDYYAYFPLVLAYILYSYIKYQNRDLSTLFID